MPAYEALRQNVINRLDLFGTKTKAANASQTTLDIASHAESTQMAPSASAASTVSRSSYLTTSEAPSSRRNSIGAFSTMSTATSATSAPPTPGTAGSPPVDVVESLENHPIFRSIIARCREVLNAEVGLLTILDEGSQLFLASGGLPDGVGDSLPRSASFCGHTILNEDRGMVVLNALDDWRCVRVSESPCPFQTLTQPISQVCKQHDYDAPRCSLLRCALKKALAFCTQRS